MTDGVIAARTKQTAYLTRLVVVIDVETTPKSISLIAMADSADTAL